MLVRVGLVTEGLRPQLRNGRIGLRVGLEAGAGARSIRSMRTPAALLPALLLLSACDAAATAKSDVKTEVVTPTVAVDGAALADAKADANVDANVAANVAANVDANVAVDGTARTAVLADGKLTVSAEAFKLGTVTTLVQSGTIETAEELELAVNDPESDINTLDVDLDGKIDHVEVIEVRTDADARVDFQMRVIPSSKASVEHSIELASASMVAARATSEVSFSASFSASVGFFAGGSAQAEVHSFVTPATFEASAVVVALPLLSWAFIVERPVYTSVFVQAGTGRWVPPGHLKHGLWKATGEVRGGGMGHGKGGGKFEGHGGGGVHGKAGGGSPFKHSGKAEASGSKHGGLHVGGKVGGSVGGKSGGKVGGSIGGKAGGSIGGKAGGSIGGKAGGSVGGKAGGSVGGKAGGGSKAGGGGKGGKGK